jgi:glycine/D-amino acid oxidase-like deaminating enzyme
MLTAAGAALFLGGMQGCGLAPRRAVSNQPAALQLPPVRASVDRITRITVCTRPFRAEGPRIELERVGQKNVVHNYGHGGSGWSLNATGYGARALFSDASITPVRGQLARGIPQPEVVYALFYRGVSFVPRRDRLVFQVVGDSDYFGFGDDSTEPDRAEAELAVNTIGNLFAPI